MIIFPQGNLAKEPSLPNKTPEAEVIIYEVSIWGDQNFKFLLHKHLVELIRSNFAYYFHVNCGFRVKNVDPHKQKS